MKLNHELRSGVLLKRYKRFFADVKTEDGEVTLHVPNSGSMKGCSEPGSPCRFTLHNDPKKKLKGTLHFVKSLEGTWVGVNTALPNPLVYELWAGKKFFPWQTWDRCEREIKIHEGSRLDLVMWNSRDGFQGGRPKITDLEKSKFHFVEIKNVSLAEGPRALFPDSVTERGQKHLLDLMDLVKMGHSAELVFVIQRTDVERFRPADSIDPVYGEYLRKAHAQGVTVTPLTVALQTFAGGYEVELGLQPLPLDLK